MNKAPISVVITTYNDAEYLDQAIVSILNQELLPSELIIVDDGSTNLDAEKITNKYLSNERGVELFFFRKENGGASSARNLGLQKSKQKYISFLDVDDTMLSNNLKEKFNIISSLDDKYFGVFGDAIRSTGAVDHFPDFDGIADPNLLDIQEKGVPGGLPFYLFNKNALIEIGGLDENLRCNEDYDILIRLIKNKKLCVGTTNAGFYRNIRPNSLSRSNEPYRTFYASMFFLDKAKKLNYYDNATLNYKRMAAHITCAKGLIYQKQLFQAFTLARAGFKYSKPFTLKQKLVYYSTFSFL